MRRPGLTGDIWPDDIQQLLLKAALLSSEQGSAAWVAVRPRINVDHLPGELHRLMPLLSRAATGGDFADPDLARLKGVYQFSWYRNTMLFTDGAGLLGALTAAGVPTMLLRGAAIAVAHHKDAGLRPMNDMDVLVRENDLDPARSVALAAGWQPLVASQPLERRIAAAPMRNSQGRLIRLHWQPSPHLTLGGSNWEGVWRRATSVGIHGQETLAPGAADHFVQLCVEGARANSGSSLRWIADAMALLGAPAADLDWDRVVTEAKRLHISLLIAEALRYLQETFNVEAPADVLVALGEGSSRRDRLAHMLSMTTTPRVASAAEIVGRFIRLTADKSVLQTAAAAPNYLATVLDIEPGLDFPLLALKKMVRAVLSPAPPVASLSKAGAADVPSTSGPRRNRSNGSPLAT